MKNPHQAKMDIPPRNARDFAIEVIRSVVAKRQQLDETLEFLGRQTAFRDLSPSDRGLARAIATVAIRWHGLIRKVITTRLREGMPPRSGPFEGVLIAAIAQILFLDVPDYAAVNTAIDTLRDDRLGQRYTSLANAILRTVTREKEAILAEFDPLRDNTPEWLAERWTAAYGEDIARAIAASHCAEPPLDISVKSAPQAWVERLGARLLPTGTLRLTSRGAVPELPGFADGEWWVQDAAAALPALLLNAAPGERVLDLCAAPGGKTAQLAAAGANVTAVDRSPQRLKRLEENMTRLRLAVEAHASDALSFEAEPFGKILLDAPCSATGTLRRHPDVAWNKTLADIAQLIGLQARLLDRAWTLLAPGGTLVYATCSLEREEGEAQIAAFLSRTPNARVVPVVAAEVGGVDAFVTAAGYIRTLPSHFADVGGCDGFFAARLEKLVA